MQSLNLRSRVRSIGGKIKQRRNAMDMETMSKLLKRRIKINDLVDRANILKMERQIVNDKYLDIKNSLDKVKKKTKKIRIFDKKMRGLFSELQDIISKLEHISGVEFKEIKRLNKNSRQIKIILHSVFLLIYNEEIEWKGIFNSLKQTKFLNLIINFERSKVNFSLLNKICTEYINDKIWDIKKIIKISKLTSLLGKWVELIVSICKNEKQWKKNKKILFQLKELKRKNLKKDEKLCKNFEIIQKKEIQNLNQMKRFNLEIKEILRLEKIKSKNGRCVNKKILKSKLFKIEIVDENEKYKKEKLFKIKSIQVDLLQNDIRKSKLVDITKSNRKIEILEEEITNEKKVIKKSLRNINIIDNFIKDKNFMLSDKSLLGQSFTDINGINKFVSKLNNKIEVITKKVGGEINNGSLIDSDIYKSTMMNSQIGNSIIFKELTNQTDKDLLNTEMINKIEFLENKTESKIHTKSINSELLNSEMIITQKIINDNLHDKNDYKDFIKDNKLVKSQIINKNIKKRDDFNINKKKINLLSNNLINTEIEINDMKNEKLLINNNSTKNILEAEFSANNELINSDEDIKDLDEVTIDNNLNDREEDFLDNEILRKNSINKIIKIKNKKPRNSLIKTEYKKIVVKKSIKIKDLKKNSIKKKPKEKKKKEKFKKEKKNNLPDKRNSINYKKKQSKDLGKKSLLVNKTKKQKQNEKKIKNKKQKEKNKKIKNKKEKKIQKSLNEKKNHNNEILSNDISNSFINKNNLENHSNLFSEKSFFEIDSKKNLNIKDNDNFIEFINNSETNKNSNYFEENENFEKNINFKTEDKSKFGKKRRRSNLNNNIEFDKKEISYSNKYIKKNSILKDKKKEEFNSKNPKKIENSEIFNEMTKSLNFKKKIFDNKNDMRRKSLNFTKKKKNIEVINITRKSLDSKLIKRNFNKKKNKSKIEKNKSKKYLKDSKNNNNTLDKRNSIKKSLTKKKTGK